MNRAAMARASIPLGLLVVHFAIFAGRDAPNQVEKAYGEFQHLRGLDNDARRAEMFFREPGQLKTVKRYFAFIDAIVARTPEDARVGLRGLPAKPLYKFAHYYLFPRHPFAVDGLDDAAIAELRAGDVLIVAGKGHETGQIIGTTVRPFDDVEAVREAAKDLGGVAA